MIFNNFENSKPRIYFIGIGGISMSALAKYLILNGFLVSGSDKQANSETLNMLSSIGCKLFVGHNPQNMVGHDIIVYNSAISSDNPELKFAIDNKMAIVKRSVLLNMIANSFNKSVGIAGCHGKTTSAALLGNILLKDNKAFTSHIGGFDLTLGNLCFKGKDIFVSEVCEYSRSIDDINANIATVLNVDYDHMESFGTKEVMRDCYFNFLNRSDYAVINIDDEVLSTYDKSKITYSVNKSKNADYFANILDIGKTLSIDVYEGGNSLYSLKTKEFSRFMVSNILAVTVCARLLNVQPNIIQSGLQSFVGVKRRNELIGKINQAKIIADYCHHPRELSCVINSYQSKMPKNGRLFIVFQPHTYSRTKLLFNDFIKVFCEMSTENTLYLYKTYAARELPEMGKTSNDLHNALPFSQYYDNFSELFNKLKAKINSGDTVLILGAGDLYNEFVNVLKK